MANPTTNYGFVLPTSSDLVTDLPADFDVALQGVDTRLKALNPETTLGDISYASATANTNTRRAIGTTGQVLTVVGGVPAWATAAAGAGVSVKVNNSNANKSTTSTTYVAIDTTNCRITATPSGTSGVMFLQAFINMSGSVTEGFWTISGGGTASPYQVYNNSYDNQVRPNVIGIIPITGLTAGTSYNFDWMWRTNSGGTFGMVGDQTNNYPRMVFIG